MTAGAAPSLRRRPAVVTPRARRRAARRPWLAIALVVALMWPTAYPLVLGTIELPPYRALLLLGMPLAAWRLAQHASRLRAPDFLILLFSIVIAVSLIVHHGLFSPFIADSDTGGIASVGYQAVTVAVVETAGAYFLARAVITEPAHFKSFMTALGAGVLILCVFTVVEARTGANVFGVAERAGVGELRYGLHRAAGPFPHSILWGLFAATPFAFFAAQIIWRRRLSAAVLALASLVGVITSVSSTAVLAVAVQAGSLFWARFAPIKRRWMLLAAGGLAAFAVIEAIADRPAIRVLIGHLSLSPSTGYYRLQQWDYGWREVMANPLLGLGLNPWERPPWLAASIDSYWLALSVRHGLIAPALLLAAIALLMLQAAKAWKRRDASRRVRLLIRVWSITIASLAVAALAVHFWAQSLIVFFFLLGCLGALTRSDAGERARA